MSNAIHAAVSFSDKLRELFEGPGHETDTDPIGNREFRAMLSMVTIAFVAFAVFLRL